MSRTPMQPLHALRPSVAEAARKTPEASKDPVAA